METKKSDYLESVKKQFIYYRTLGEKAMAQLYPEQLFEREGEESNSIAIIVQHLSGNMRSRWTDFLVSDGEKDWRDRDLEFEEALQTQDEVFSAWNKGWDCLFSTLDQLEERHLDHIIYIRNEGHTVIEAINRQLAHYPYHIGQIVFQAKRLARTPWQSLSIPRKQSSQYNSAKFAREKTVRHFTDDELDRIK